MIVESERQDATEPSARLQEIADWILIFLGVLCAGALIVSIYPGVLNDLTLLAILLSFVIVPIVGVFGLVVLIILMRQNRLAMLLRLRKQAVILFVMLIGTIGLLKLYVPRRIAFALSRSSFERIAASTAPENVLQQGRYVGVYFVDKFATDIRGGMFFRIHRGADGLGPDEMSYGFALRPNREGTPFGAAEYRLFSLGGDWYWFKVSDDW